jgi:hypothetical protein
VQERLTALAMRLEAIASRIRTIGLTRAAEDLAKISAELRRLGADEANRPFEPDRAPDVGPVNVAVSVE